ncbi:GRAS family protein RAD1-like [Zingiber officinale]|uniref:DELLA protein RGL1 n=1 Tax=Zingiber officinale TaxID=94328 RepID=A0A8J5LPP9_ZINOF|nr:GRAS family protein RAD1-like [Zingiber officinale]XP_042465967.1 GRAS family protein RAD1-like [Zingiber officinale]KAG6528755.1 hypothetical protein ZIOFF_010940 [Zingiber officinale]
MAPTFPYVDSPEEELQQMNYNEEVDESGTDFNLSSISKLDPNQIIYYLPTWDHTLSWLSPPPELRYGKKLRTTDHGASIAHFEKNAAGDHEKCARKLQFRNIIDLVDSYKQKFSAQEVLGEMPEADAGMEEVAGGSASDGMRLVQLLISCAEAVACRDRVQASALLAELKVSALVLGTSFQRVASCFVQGLSDRLALVQPLGAVGIVGPATVPSLAFEKKDEALGLAYELCPYIQFGHFVANAAILEVLEGESPVHVVDLGMTQGLPHGHQWRKLLDALAARGVPPPRRLRITGVGPRVEHLQVIGDELKSYAARLGLRLEFSVLESNLENLRPEDFEVEEGEIVAVNSVLQLHCVVKESRGALNAVLQMIHELQPAVLVVVEQDSSHNGPFFLGRFMEALHYYSAIFDSLDAMLPKYDTKRAKVEQFHFAEEIKNIVSCEGPARVERHERVDQWRRRMSRAGFQPAPIKMMGQAKQWLAKFRPTEGYTIAEEKGCLLLGWKSKPIIAASSWKC